MTPPERRWGCGGWLAVLIVVGLVTSWAGETAGAVVLWVALGTAATVLGCRALARLRKRGCDDG
ncbi:MAG TPA: hypothetical protein VF288_10725 [Mycobacteriales bacterium]